MLDREVVSLVGGQHRLIKVNAYRDEELFIPDNAVVLHTEVVIDGVDEALEVWFAVPEASSSVAPVVGIEQVRTHMHGDFIPLPDEDFDWGEEEEDDD